MRIGIDIDGVLTDYLQYSKEVGTKWCNQNKKGKLIDPDAYDTMDMFGWSKLTDLKFWKENIFDYAKNNPVLPDASTIIKKLKEEKHTIYIITARWLASPKTDKVFQSSNDIKHKMRNTVKEWLAKNEIDYDYIIFSEEDKSKYIKENKIDVMIDDSVRNVLSLSKITKVICYDWPYNRKIEGANIYRCYNWNDIYDKIKELEKSLFQQK